MTFNDHMDILAPPTIVICAIIGAIFCGYMSGKDGASIGETLPWAIIGMIAFGGMGVLIASVIVAWRTAPNNTITVLTIVTLTLVCSLGARLLGKKKL